MEQTSLEQVEERLRSQLPVDRDRQPASRSAAFAAYHARSPNRQQSPPKGQQSDSRGSPVLGAATSPASRSARSSAGVPQTSAMPPSAMASGGSRSQPASYVPNYVPPAPAFLPPQKPRSSDGSSPFRPRSGAQQPLAGDPGSQPLQQLSLPPPSAYASVQQQQQQRDVLDAEQAKRAVLDEESAGGEAAGGAAAEGGGPDEPRKGEGGTPWRGACSTSIGGAFILAMMICPILGLFALSVLDGRAQAARHSQPFWCDADPAPDGAARGLAFAVRSSGLPAGYTDLNADPADGCLRGCEPTRWPALWQLPPAVAQALVAGAFDLRGSGPLHAVVRPTEGHPLSLRNLTLALAPPGASLEAACSEHDRCYATHRRARSAAEHRSACDSELQLNLAYACAQPLTVARQRAAEGGGGHASAAEEGGPGLSASAAVEPSASCAQLAALTAFLARELADFETAQEAALESINSWDAGRRLGLAAETEAEAEAEVEAEAEAGPQANAEAEAVEAETEALAETEKSRPAFAGAERAPFSAFAALGAALADSAQPSRDQPRALGRVLTAPVGPSVDPSAVGQGACEIRVVSCA